MTDQNTRAGLLFALCGFAVLSLGDAVVKTMAQEWSPVAVAALRFTMGAIALSGFLAIREGAPGFRPAKLWLQAARGLSLAGATLCFFSAIFVMPLADATAIGFVAPFLVAILSGPLLKEKVPASTWVAATIAFGGVLLVLRPNLAELGVAALLPLGGAVFVSLLMIGNRAAAGTGSALSMQVFLAAFAAPALIVAAFLGNATGVSLLAFGWPDWTIIARCAFVTVTASTAHMLIYLGTTKAGAATIAPMTYVQLLVAAVLGWLWFDDVPDVLAMLGAAIIVCSGLIMWWAGKPKTG